MGKNDGRDLLAIGYAVSSVLSEGKSADEISVLGAFFTVLGDSLSLIAARMDLCGSAAQSGGTSNGGPDASAADTSGSKTTMAGTAASNTSAANTAINIASTAGAPAHKKSV